MFDNSLNAFRLDNQENRIAVLESKSHDIVDLSPFAKKSDEDARIDNDTIQDLTPYALKSDEDSRVDNDTQYDLSPYALIATENARIDRDTVFNNTLNENRLTALEADTHKIQDLSSLATLTIVDALDARLTAEESKIDNDTIYDDTALIDRITAEENKPDNDTIFDNSLNETRLTALELSDIQISEIPVVNRTITPTAWLFYATGIPDLTSPSLVGDRLVITVSGGADTEFTKVPFELPLIVDQDNHGYWFGSSSDWKIRLFVSSSTLDVLQIASGFNSSNQGFLNLHKIEYFDR